MSYRLFVLSALCASSLFLPGNSTKAKETSQNGALLQQQSVIKSVQEGLRVRDDLVYRIVQYGTLDDIKMVQALTDIEIGDQDSANIKKRKPINPQAGLMSLALIQTVIYAEFDANFYKFAIPCNKQQEASMKAPSSRAATELAEVCDNFFDWEKTAYPERVGHIGQTPSQPNAAQPH